MDSTLQSVNRLDFSNQWLKYNFLSLCCEKVWWDIQATNPEYVGSGGFKTALNMKYYHWSSDNSQVCRAESYWDTDSEILTNASKDYEIKEVKDLNSLKGYSGPIPEPRDVRIFASVHTLYRCSITPLRRPLKWRVYNFFKSITFSHFFTIWRLPRCLI